MDETNDEDEYAPGDDPANTAEDSLLSEEEPALFNKQDSPGRFDELPEAETQDGPDLFGETPDRSRAQIVAAAIRPARQDEPEITPIDEQRTRTPGLDQTVTEPKIEPPESETPAKAAPAQRMEPSAAALALYRRYRPDTFADVIGQEHVTAPLQRALVNNRVNHAYLFSGPRGCGKTTSARILARCLNCATGPTPHPCGECQSCRDLARGGVGSIDVIEIDAASHGGVDDARDLRERAYFAPVQSRYKIYIIDEAHMVTTGGFNALLKLVEEPPPHVKFIFATTEPEKVIGTIRSRTHHYPFRLVPPRVLADYLAELCQAEKVSVEHSVLPLVVRAGAGSVRDCLSVLDQLLGAADSGVSYPQAAALLGYTPDALLDEVVDAFAAGDAAGVFATVDKVIEVGQDPRRFAEDLLRRLRDLIIVAAVPDAAMIGLIDVADDQAQRLATQVAGMGPGELTRAAEVLANGLTEMRGTTAPRLHLELMCARILLPGADVNERGIHARLDRLERRVQMADAPAEPKATEWADLRQESPLAATAPQAGSAAASGQRLAQRPAPRSAGQPKPSQPVRQPGAMPVAEVRRLWPDVLALVKERRRYTWMLLSQHAQVLDVEGNKLILGFSNAGARDNFGQRGSHDILRDVLVERIGADFHIVASVSEETAHQRPAGETAQPPPSPVVDQAPEPEPEISEDDEVIDDTDASITQLLAHQLGAELIHEEPRS